MPFQAHLKPRLNHFNGPVTAVSIWSEKSLIGCGNEVSIYCLNSLRLETRQQVLHGASIHGFSKGGVDDKGRQLICVYGAKQACVIALESDKHTITHLSAVSDILHLPDWIWEARWVKHAESNNTIAFALAHNTVVLWDWKTNIIMDRRDCVEKCILYCAHFIGDNWTSLVLAAGTVFNQVVLWLVSDGDNVKGQQPVPVMHTFSGHKGVIFSIRYHAQLQRMCSVSDDRSIRMWQIDFPRGQTVTPNAEDWKEMKSSLLLSVFGHSARVFGAVLMTRYFASVGEDATCCIWDYSGQVISKFKGHKGKCIWSVAATEDEQHILTGGGDGSVRMWKINTEQDNSQAEQVLDVSKLLSLNKDDFPRTVTLLDFERVLIMMNSGSLFCYSMDIRQFDCVFKDGRFISYSVVAPCPDKVKVAVASIGGVIKILQLIPGTSNEVLSVEESLFDNKILAIVWISHNRLVVSGQNGACHLLQITVETDSPVLRIVRECSLFLPMAKHRWISAACPINTSLETEAAVGRDTKAELLACGDKDGTIHLYQISSISTPSQIDYIQPCQSFHKIHGKNGVNHLVFHDGVMYSIGRDGCCRHWGVEGGQLVLRHGSKVVKGFEWIDRLEYRDDDLLFYGFFSTQFVIWSQRYNQRMFYVECGGGHRSWGCCQDNQGAFRFVYLKGGLVNVVDSAQCSRHEILKPPLHGRELHDVKLLNMTDTDSVNPSFLTFVASEDTLLTVGSYHNINGFMHWKPLATLKGHLSSVRALALLKEPGKHSDEPFHFSGCDKQRGVENNFILFTGGGRAEIRVWLVQVKNKSNNAVDIQNSSSECNSGINDSRKGEDSMVCTHQEWSTHYLGESRHKRPFSKWKTRKLCLDPETRVMSLDATSVCDIGSVSSEILSRCQQDPAVEDNDCSNLENLHIVSAAGSDGLLRVFCYNNETRQLTPVAQSSFHQGCVLKVLHFHFKPTHSNDMFLAFSTSTNGQIAVWFLDSIARKALALERDATRLSKTSNDKIHKGYANAKFSTFQRDTLESTHSKELEEDDDSEICDGEDADNIDASVDDSNATAQSKDDVDQTENFHPICCLPAHQSGVNCIHALQIDDTTFLLASGGDDNALTVQRVKVKGQELKGACRTSNRNAHNAQITGIRLVSANVLVSSSIDQRVCVWALEGLEVDITMHLLNCAYIYLADVSCMDVSLHGNAVYLCLGGEGLCLYSWEEYQSTEKDRAISGGQSEEN